jgi:hypothetical protein
MVIITGIIPLAVLQADLQLQHVHQHNPQLVSQRDLLLLHRHANLRPRQPVLQKDLLPRLNPQQQISLLHLHPDQIQVTVPGVHLVQVAAEAEEDRKAPQLTILLTMIFLLNLIGNYIINIIII